jgi:hypothetical protein
MSNTKETDPKNLQLEKEDPNLITVFICFLRSGLRFTRFDTNNVGLAFIEEIKKHNPSFKPTKVQQRERDNIYTVNAYPKEFEQLIMSLIEEYRKKHNLEYRLKKRGGPRGGGRGGFNRGGGRPGAYNQNRNQRSGGNFSRPGGNTRAGGYGQRREADGNRGGYRPRRDYPSGGGYGQPRRDGDASQDGGYRPGKNYDDQRGQGGGFSRNRGYSNENRGYGSSNRGYANDNSSQPDGSHRPRRDPDQQRPRDASKPAPNDGTKEDENKRPARPETGADSSSDK